MNPTNLQEWLEKTAAERKRLCDGERKGIARQTKKAAEQAKRRAEFFARLAASKAAK